VLLLALFKGLGATMPNSIFAETTASVSELKKNPMGTVALGEGFPVAILNRNAPAFYCIPAKAYEALIDKLEDFELNAIADARAGQKVIKVKIEDL
jgi:antitoxin StbD